MLMSSARMLRHGRGRTTRQSLAVVALGAMRCASSADAGNPTVPSWSISGFGTLGVVHSSDNQADVVGSPFQPKGAGFTNSWSATPDSKLGLQLNLDLTDRWSAVLQAVSQYQRNGTYTPDLEWANIKYQLTPNLSVRAGRIATPTFFDSDSLNVGYALPFERVPPEVYSQLPITNSDGVDSTYRFRVGDLTDTVQVFFGRFTLNLPADGFYRTHNLLGAVETIEYEAVTLRLSYQQLKYDWNFGGVGGVELHGDQQKILAAGASYDPGQWYVTGEWARAPDEAFGLFYAWYVTGGYRIAKFTPYLRYATASMSRVGSVGLPPFIDQDTVSAGLRWDFWKNLDLKLQLDHTERHGGLNADYVNQQSGFTPAGAISVFTVTVDFVF
jgi:hypothetical protein